MLVLSLGGRILPLELIRSRSIFDHEIGLATEKFGRCSDVRAGIDRCGNADVVVGHSIGLWGMDDAFADARFHIVGIHHDRNGESGLEGRTFVCLLTARVVVVVLYQALLQGLSKVRASRTHVRRGRNPRHAREELVQVKAIDVVVVLLGIDQNRTADNRGSIHPCVGVPCFHADGYRNAIRGLVLKRSLLFLHARNAGSLDACCSESHGKQSTGDGAPLVGLGRNAGRCVIAIDGIALDKQIVADREDGVWLDMGHRVRIQNTNGKSETTRKSCARELLSFRLDVASTSPPRSVLHGLWTVGCHADGGVGRRSNGGIFRGRNLGIVDHHRCIGICDANGETEQRQRGWHRGGLCLGRRPCRKVLGIDDGRLLRLRSNVDLSACLGLGHPGEQTEVQHARKDVSNLSSPKAHKRRGRSTKVGYVQRMRGIRRTDHRDVLTSNLCVVDRHIHFGLIEIEEPKESLVVSVVGEDLQIIDRKDLDITVIFAFWLCGGRLGEQFGTIVDGDVPADQKDIASDFRAGVEGPLDVDRIGL